MLKLMQPKLHVPADHPLLTNDYCESEPWSAEEIDTFQQCIFKFDKNFPRIAQNVRKSFILFNKLREVCVFYNCYYLICRLFSIQRWERKQPSNVFNFIIYGRRPARRSIRGVDQTGD